MSTNSQRIAELEIKIKELEQLAVELVQKVCDISARAPEPSGHKPCTCADVEQFYLTHWLFLICLKNQ